MTPQEQLAHDYAKNMALYNSYQHMNAYGRTVEEMAEIKLAEETALANAKRAESELQELLKNKRYTA